MNLQNISWKLVHVSSHKQLEEKKRKYIKFIFVVKKQQRLLNWKVVEIYICFILIHRKFD